MLADGTTLVVPSECVSEVDHTIDDTAPQRLIPTVPLETFYRSLRRLTGSSSAQFQAIHEALESRHGPKGAAFLAELFRRSVRHAEAYANIDEGFYSRRKKRASTKPRFARVLVETALHQKKIQVGSSSHSVVDYEVFPFRTTYSCMENGRSASSAGSGGIDLLLASQSDGIYPIVCEVKAATETVGPTFALVQSLMYSSQLATQNQFIRMGQHYPTLFGSMRPDPPTVGVLILLEKTQKVSRRDLEYAIRLSQGLCGILSPRLREIMFSWCNIADGSIRCEVIHSDQEPK